MIFTENPLQHRRCEGFSLTAVALRRKILFERVSEMQKKNEIRYKSGPEETTFATKTYVRLCVAEALHAYACRA